MRSRSKMDVNNFLLMYLAKVVALLLFLYSTSAFGARRVCKTHILRSIELSSRISPSRTSTLCPNIEMNCCSRNDQMRLHKLWNTISKGEIEGKHASSIALTKSLALFVNEKETYNFTLVAEMFKTFAKPPEKFNQHLVNIVDRIKKVDSEVLGKLFKRFIDKKELENMFATILNLRRNFLCSHCDYDQHAFINPESFTINYKKSFCQSLIDNFIILLEAKFVQIYPLVLLVDEFTYLISGKYILSHFHRVTLQRYRQIVEKCSKNRENIISCIEVCAEFNGNQYSLMFDGESELLDEFDSGVKEIITLFKDPKQAELSTLFKFRLELWQEEKLKGFQLEESVLSTRIRQAPPPLHKVSMVFKVSSEGVKTLIDYKHPPNPFQIDTLDDEISAFTLYRLVDKPIDVSTFIPSYDARGIDLFSNIDDHNFDVPVDQFLALLSTNGANLKVLNEVVDPEVKQLIANIEVTNIKEFMSDIFIEFKRYSAKPKSQPKPQQRKLKMNHIDILKLGFLCMLAFGLIS